MNAVTVPLTPCSTSVTDSGKCLTIPLCAEQMDWLKDVAKRHDLGADQALEKLIDRANVETPHCKRTIFLTIRCRRCLQHTRGGDKRDYEITLPEHQWTWLENVQARSRHPTVGKTVRILLDFYIPLCLHDEDFEQALFQCPKRDIAVSSIQA